MASSKVINLGYQKGLTSGMMSSQGISGYKGERIKRNERKRMRFQKAITEKAICEDEQDFYKLAMAWLDTTTPEDISPEDAKFVLYGFKILLHEYFALVYAGDIIPYTFHKEAFDGPARETFRDLMNNVNERIVECGFPTIEKNGKVHIDIDKIKEDLWRDRT